MANWDGGLATENCLSFLYHCCNLYSSYSKFSFVKKNIFFCFDIPDQLSTFLATNIYEYF